MEWVSHQDTVEWRLYTGGFLSWLWQSSQPSLEVVRVALQPESRESSRAAAENERRVRRSVLGSGWDDDDDARSHNSVDLLQPRSFKSISNPST